MARELVEHPVTCIDCHDPKSMALRVTRPLMWLRTAGRNGTVVLRDFDTTDALKKAPGFATKGMSIIARVEVTGTAGSICVERFEDYPQLGRFTLRFVSPPIVLPVGSRCVCVCVLIASQRPRPDHRHWQDHQAHHRRELRLNPQIRKWLREYCWTMYCRLGSYVGSACGCHRRKVQVNEHLVFPCLNKYISLHFFFFVCWMPFIQCCVIVGSGAPLLPADKSIR